MKSVLFLYLFLHFYDTNSENLNNYNCREIGDMTNNINNKPFYSMKIFSCIIPYNGEALINIDPNNTITTSPNVTSISPNVTSISPNITSISPNITSISPNITSISPNITSISPNVTSISPNVTSISPNVTSISPSPTIVKEIEEIQEIQEDIQQNDTLSNTDQEQHNLTLSEKLNKNEIVIIVVLSIGLPFVAGILLILFIYQKKCKIYCKKCCKKCCKNKVKTDITIIDLEQGQEHTEEHTEEQKSKITLKNNPTKINRQKRLKILLKKVSDTDSNDTEETVEQKTRN